MKPKFIYEGTQDYITHTFIGEERIIPSDSFDIGDNEYLLLEILKSTDDIIFLKIIGLKGTDMGNIYLIPKHEFEEQTMDYIKQRLVDYQH